MPRQSKEESGAQLLARLGTRPDLSSIDPYIFDSTFRNHHMHLSSRLNNSNGGRLLEISGPEGVGKSELALRYVALTCLPHAWDDTRIGGVGGKVIVIDSDLKFSVLRLAVVMEKLILDLVQTTPSPPTEAVVEARRGLGAPCAKIDIGGSTQSTCRTDVTSSVSTSMWSADKDCNRFFYDRDHQPSTCSSLKCTDAKRNCAVTEQEEEPVKAQTCSSSRIPEDQEKCSSTGSHVIPSPEDIECIVQEALGRVQVVKPATVQQLFLTLLSLEQSLTYDIETCLLLLDSVSAFFWEDRLAENTAWTQRQATGASRAKHKPTAAGGMTMVAEVISRLIHKLGINAIMTKAMLLGGNSSSAASSISQFSNSAGSSRKRRRLSDWETESHPNGSVQAGEGTSVGRSRNLVEEDPACTEFLGKAWLKLDPVRIVLSEDSLIQSCDSVDSGKKIRTASCSLWPCKRRFIFVEDSLHML